MLELDWPSKQNMEIRMVSICVWGESEDVRLLEKMSILYPNKRNELSKKRTVVVSGIEAD